MSQASQKVESTSPSYDELVATNRKLEQELEFLRFQLEELKQHVFGKRSEKIYPDSPKQGNLFEGFVENVNEGKEVFSEISGYKRKRSSKKSIPTNLPIEEKFHKPAETHCSCGTELREYSRDVRKSCRV